MLTNAVKAFEGGIKFQFDPYDEDCEQEYEIPLRGAPDIPDLDLHDGYLTIRKYKLVENVDTDCSGTSSCSKCLYLLSLK